MDTPIQASQRVEPPKPTFFNFVRRYLRLIVFWVILVALGRFDALVLWFGHVFYILELVFSCVVVALFARHMFFRKSVDAFSIEPPGEQSTFQRAWDMLPINDKLKYAFATIIAFYLGACWIAASIAK